MYKLANWNIFYIWWQITDHRELSCTKKDKVHYAKFVTCGFCLWMILLKIVEVTLYIIVVIGDYIVSDQNLKFKATKYQVTTNALYVGEEEEFVGIL